MFPEFSELVLLLHPLFKPHLVSEKTMKHKYPHCHTWVSMYGCSVYLFILLNGVWLWRIWRIYRSEVLLIKWNKSIKWRNRRTCWEGYDIPSVSEMFHHLSSTNFLFSYSDHVATFSPLTSYCYWTFFQLQIFTQLLCQVLVFFDSVRMCLSSMSVSHFLPLTDFFSFSHFFVSIHSFRTTCFEMGSLIPFLMLLIPEHF